jgi:putative oxidoreductase
MDEGLLLLRLLLAAVLVAHATQKTLGWFSGPGLDKASGFFESKGMRPGRPTVLAAAAAELVAAGLVGLGALTPLGAMVAAGTMLVAGLTMHLSAGSFWNALGGGEYPYVLAAVAMVLGFTGPGAWSLDALTAAAWPWGGLATEPTVLVGVVVVLGAAAAAVPFGVLLRRNLGTPAERVPRP